MTSLALSAWAHTFPPGPDFTERDVPDLSQKVYIVTGANSGLGKELARMLYAKNATVYMATRSKAKAYKAIDDIRKAEPASTGSLMFLFLDLADFIAIKTSVQQFLAAERKLHVLFNNAGIMAAREETAKTVQGHEIHLGVNCLGTFLFTKLLTPILLATAADTAEVPNTVRVVWVSSFAAELFAATGVGIPVDNLDYHVDKSVMYKYAISKTGSWAYGVEFAKRYKAAGIISIPLSPGFLHSGLFRHQGFALSLLCWMFARPAVNGAYTQLFAGLSSKVTIDISGSWVVPSGRVYPIRADLNAATRKAADGGTGGTHKFWEWSEDQVRPFLL